MTKDEALRLALEALEQWNTPLYKRGAVITAIKETLETKDEPVALKVYRGELCYKSQADDQSFGIWCPVTQDLPFPEGTKFYTTPQRTWVGLTNDDMSFLFPHGKSVWVQEIVKIIENKLKERNT